MGAPKSTDDSEANVTPDSASPLEKRPREVGEWGDAGAGPPPDGP
jgi:hypothetical protein